MSRTLPLDGDDWAFREALGETWRWYVSDEPPAMGNSVADAVAAAQAVRGWLPGRVPGSVIGDLARHGEIADPLVGRNSLAAEWTKERFWIYRRPVELPPLADGEFVTVELDGVDPAADVRLDGVFLGRVEGLYHAHRLVVPPELAAPGAHWLTLTLEPAPATEPQVGRTDAVTRHLPRMGYGWDFCPRLVHQGVWQPVRLVVGGAQLGALSARPEVLPDGAGRVHLAATVVSPPGRGPAGEVSFEVRTPDGRTLAARAAVAGGRAAAAIDVADPALWWPHGYGEQPRYRVSATLRDGPHEDTRTLATGFRTLAWAPNPGAPAGALGYTATVNGRPLALAGWNWVPQHVLYGEIDADAVEHLIDLAVAAGARLLRVWGGGLIETERFYDACDARGVLVWQEFTQSSSGPASVPSAEPAFVAHLRQEAARIVPTRTHHPCLAAWAGGNELGADNVPLTTEDSPALVALRDACASLDPGRPWFATSPTGPVFGNSLAMTDADLARQHDVHGPWEHQGLRGQHTLANRGNSLAHTEFGAEGMTNRRTLDGLIPPDAQWPCDRTNPLYRHTGVWWINAPLVQASFGGRLSTTEAVRRASQLLQATGLQYAVEADRRRSPRLSMVLPWQLNEPFPNAWCTSAVDAHGTPKPAFDSLARAFADRRVTIRTDSSVWPDAGPAAQAWVWSFLDEVPAGSRVVLELLDAAGAVLAAAGATLPDAVAQPRAAVALAPDRPERGGIVVWRARWYGADGVLLDDERSLAALAADWAGLGDLPEPHVGVRASDAGVTVVNEGPAILVNPRLTDARPLGAAGWPLVAPDNRVLLPGEARTYGVRWSEGADRGPLRFESYDPRADLEVHP